MTTTEKSRFAGRIRAILGALIIVVAVIAVSIAVNSPNGINIQLSATQRPQQALPTMNPNIIAQLTALPNATPISAEEDATLVNLRNDVLACADYSETRRSQMLQHLDWLRDPTVIPPDIAIAFSMSSHSITGGLIYGMAIFTSTEWRLLKRPASSCLIDIGRKLNDMLVTAGEPPLTIYDKGSQ